MLEGASPNIYSKRHLPFSDWPPQAASDYHAKRIRRGSKSELNVKTTQSRNVF